MIRIHFLIQPEDANVILMNAGARIGEVTLAVGQEIKNVLVIIATIEKKNVSRITMIGKDITVMMQVRIFKKPNRYGL